VVVTKGDDIYIGKGKTGWEKAAGKNGIAGAILCRGEKERIILAWSEKEIFRVENDEWKRLGSSSLWSRGIDDAAYKDGVICVASGGDIYYSDREGNWEKKPVFKKYENTGENGDLSGLNGDLSEEEDISLSENIALDGRGNMLLLMKKGIFIINEEDDTREHIVTTGLPSARVKYASRIGTKLFAATDKRAFVYSGKEKGWRKIFSAPYGRISSLEASVDGEGHEWVWVSDGRSLFRRSADFPDEPKLNRTDHEPSIREVQKMAIDYAEVSPEKIRRWRNAARWKALLPRLSLGFGESRDDNVEIYTSSTMSYHYIAPKEIDSGWDIDLVWDLSDLVWNDAQTSIDVRSKLMVQLRDEILEEVTRLYFERRKLLAELDEAGAGGDEKLSGKKLRIEELTAHIDALTGGRFSDIINKE
jgi:hypothetical protein